MTLPVDDRAPAQARALLRQAHCPELGTDALDESLLMVSEVVTNAVRHGGPQVSLEIRCAGLAGVTVRVTDGNPRPPALTRGGLREESGRGVVLVDALSDAWGVEPGYPGKTVWFTLGSSYATCP